MSDEMEHLMTRGEEAVLAHFGVKGMRWGFRKDATMRALASDKDPKNIDRSVNSDDVRTKSGVTSGGSRYQGYKTKTGYDYTKYSDGRKQIWPPGKEKPITLAPPSSKAWQIMDTASDALFWVSVGERLAHDDLSQDVEHNSGETLVKKLLSKHGTDNFISIRTK